MASPQCHLGVLCTTGRGVLQDHAQAYMLLTLAAARFPASEAGARGNAVGLRDRIAAKMTPAQIAGAQRLAQDWKPK